jgi:membrane protein
MGILKKIKIYFAKFSQDEIMGMASALAFSIITSLIPIIALAYFIFALFGGFQDLRGTVEQFAFQYIAPSFADDLSGYVRTIEKKVSPNALGIFGIIGFIYSGFSMIGQAESSLNKMWGALTPRSFAQRLVRYTSAILFAPLLLGGSLAMTSYLASQFGRLRYFSEPLLFLLTAVPYIFSSVLFSGIFYFLPNTKVNQRAAIQAGLITGLTFEVLKQGFAYYASFALKNSVYGSLAALPIMILWLYLIALVFLAGGELCYFLDQRRKGVFHFAPDTSLLSMAMLRDILRIYCDPLQLEPLGIREVVSRLKWDQSIVLRHVHFLVKAQILRIAADTGPRAECFETVDKDFGHSLLNLTRALNKVRYEQVEIPAAPVLEHPTNEVQRRKVAQKYWDSPIEVH